MASKHKSQRPPPAESDDQRGDPDRKAATLSAKGRQSEFAVSRGGMNQESRQHNKPQAG